MASLQTSFRPGSKTDWRKHLASVTHYIDDLEICLAQANSTLTPQSPISGSGENKIIPACAEDVWCEVKDKLTAISDLFSFFDSLEFYDKPVSLKKGTLGGAIRILDDCIDKLNPLFQK
jgi:hypothetical protein